MINEDKTLLEETHYYPFGLTMKGISTSASRNLHNKEKTFQNQQIDEELDLNWVQFKYRNHDPQIGRFIEIDPLANDYVYNSTYAFSENKVTAHIELEGLETLPSNSPWVRALMRNSVQQSMTRTSDAAAKAGSVTVTLGPGIGVKAKVGAAEVKAIATGPQVAVTVTSGGNISGEGSLAGVHVKADTKVGSAQAGAAVGTFTMNGWAIKTNAVQSGADVQVGPNKEMKDGNTVVGANSDISDQSVSLTAQFGVVGAEIKANVVEAGKTVVGFFETMVN
ncbi:hypothetical protein LQ567_06685 [Niabella pedocola]|uniref:RHS repeat-associated core domain-containing protein n=1 Tax=Niabella pedocola TaxID=1752077 RepID=A0ABS8PMV9_9BACT|nr:RHS repeat-associated core domain-containing protein [Niabella pedocola]MCD2422442.1 hypothetical protein [Niabella pedocola]